MATQRLLPLDLAPRDRLLTLPIPADQRAVLLAVYDLAPDQVTWSGSARVLAAQMAANGQPCAPGTATRRAKRTAEAGYLDVDLRSGRPGCYRITCLTPASKPTAPNVDNVEPSWSELRATAHRFVALLVALVFGTRRRPAPSAEVARRRRIAPLPQQLVLDFARSAEAPSDEVSAQPGPTEAPTSAPRAEPPGITGVGASRANAEVSSIPSHSTDPPSLHLSDPIVPLHGGDGTSKRWCRQHIEDADLKSPSMVQQLYDMAVAAGVCADAEQSRITFFAWAKHVTRSRSIRNRGATFVAKLGQPDQWGKPFAARMAAVDLAWARQAIESIDLGRPAAPRTADLLADSPNSIETNRARQIADLTAYSRSR